MKKTFTILFFVAFVFILSNCKEEPDNPTSPTPDETTTPYSPNPENNSTNQELNVELRWECTGASDYEIYFGTSNPPQFRNTTSVKNETVGGLSHSTKYFWSVKANNTNGTTYESDVWNFTTKSNQSAPGYKLYNHAIETELPSFVNIMFQVTDLNGLGVSNLETTNFEVYEDDQSVSPTESAMHIKKKDIIPYTLRTVLLLDNSLSVGSNLSEIKNSALSLINNIVSQQEIAVYKFSDAPVLIQDFTNDVGLLQSAINSIELGFNSTDLYGSIIEAVSRWEDLYSTNFVVQGFLIALTDGSDTQGSHTLNQALSARGDKKVYTIGLGNEIEPDILSQIGNAGFFSITDVNNLSTKFTEIQEEMATFANSFYWLNYMSPKRGDVEHSLKLTVKDNPYSGSKSFITGDFNSNGFYSVYQGLYVNSTESNPYGIDSLEIIEGDTLLVNCTTYLGNNPPQYSWSTGNQNVISILPSQNTDSEAFIIAVGDSGQTSTFTVQDIANNLSKTIYVNVTKTSQNYEGFENGLIPSSWSTSGNANWYIVSDEHYSGNYSAKSGDISNSQSSKLYTNLSVPSATTVTISFAYKTSSESGYDYLRFYINDNEIIKYAGSNGWNIYEHDYQTQSNNLKLEWRYTKDGSQSSGQDCVWIDEVSITY